MTDTKSAGCVSVPRADRQHRIADWCAAAFGKDHATNIEQRGLRLAEEAIEAAQAANCDPATLHKLIDYIYAKEPGALAQELGGVGLCVLAMANAAGIDADDAESAECERVLSKPLEFFAARNKVKNDAGFVSGAYRQPLASSPAAPGWEDGPAKRNIDALASLEANWGGYGASKISPEAIATARSLYFVPACNGGIQIETHGVGFDLEFMIEPDGKISGGLFNDHEFPPSPSHERDRALGGQWFELRGHDNLVCCSTLHCCNPASWRFEGGGVGSNYCGNCRAKTLAQSAPAAGEKHSSPRDDLVGKWLSAALDDPLVCTEMKADINAWFNSIPTPQPVIDGGAVERAIAAFTRNPEGTAEMGDEDRGYWTSGMKRAIHAAFKREG
jgi:NTP pyrophosphatase (non-canonical NTP hydrolase)